jgi:hypothetical protein
VCADTSDTVLDYDSSKVDTISGTAKIVHRK